MAIKSRLRLGVDTGGTFTDFVWVDGNGRFHIHKQLSTPSDPSAAILSGVVQLDVPTTADVVHGSTVATNALLERRGARTALITTAGFADVLAIGRQNRPDIYALVPQKPPPLVPAAWRLTVDERVTAQGVVQRPLSPESVTAVLDQIAAHDIESVAVCLLFSFLHSDHERQIETAVRQRFPHLSLSLSCDILPEYREYERTATTVINAYVAPLMRRYLRRLAQGLAPRRLAVMQSNGGIISAETAGTEAARTALSGPAGGVVGAQFVASKSDIDHIITFDMGGTSTDVALCPGRLPTTATGEIADLPLRLPLIDIHTVGAGGGSLARVDAGGALHVGPQSAGAQPGPMAYGQPSDQAWWVTVTDANVVLGRLDATHFLGGEMTLDVAAARRGLQALAVQMGVEAAENAVAETAAWGVIQVANANMERAIRRISVERGYDPRDFTLVPFGGAGSLHACELAANMQIPQVLIPPSPGVLSALGMLVAAPTKDYSRTVLMGIGDRGSGIGDRGLGIGVAGTGDWLGEVFTPLVERANAEMAAEGHEDVALRYALDMRYKGQSHELNVPIVLDEADADSVRELFHAAHEARYGYRQAQAVVELVTLRLTAVAPVAPPDLPERPLATDAVATAVVGQKEVWFDQKPQLTTLYDRDKLQPGHRFQGPAIVFQYDTTIVIPPGWETAVGRDGSLLLTVESGT